MVYINRDGTITTNQPWGVDKIGGILFGIISFIVCFFKTLVGIEVEPNSKNSKASGSGFSSGGGGGGGGGGRGGGGGGGSGRRGPGSGGKRFFTMRDIAPPSVGGCAGGSCSL